MTANNIISFIGAGKMATAIACGLIRSGFDKEKIRAYDIIKKTGENFVSTTGAKLMPSMDMALDSADIVILAVKPQTTMEVLDSARPLLKGKLLISIAAGITLASLSNYSGLERVIRVMPNTPATIGEGMTCFTPSLDVTHEDIELVETILSSFGRCIMVKEHMMDAVTGLSGSGPAYVFDFISGLADGGVHAGLSREMAVEMAIQTVIGAAKMCLETGTAPEILRNSVISPAGTTAEGVMVLSKAGFRGIVANAVTAAAERSAELSKKT